MDSEKKLYEVAWPITIRRQISTFSKEALSTTLKNVQEIDSWQILDQLDPAFREIPVPKIAEWEPRIWLTYDRSWDKERLPGRGEEEITYIPQRLIKALGINVAFEWVTGVDSRYILQWDEAGNSLYTCTGKLWEKVMPEMTLQEFATQAFDWPLAYDTFAGKSGQNVLIVEEQQAFLKRTEALVLTFSLFVPNREEALCTWTMSGGVDTEQLAAIARYFAPDQLPDQVQGKATPA
jgi:hypothetical protein